MISISRGMHQPMRTDHLLTLADSRGILEHANGTVPRLAHGYCTDDNARLLIFAVRDGGASRGTEMLAHLAMRFVQDSQVPDGAVRNRMSFTRQWVDEPSTNDCWGRAVWALGTAAARSNDALLRHRGLNGFERSTRLNSAWLRSRCFAALGAAEILGRDPHHPIARRVLGDAADRIPTLPQSRAVGSAENRESNSVSWLWPERRLTYANAVIPEVLIAAGTLLGEKRHLQRGLELLDWLVRTESNDGHLSVTSHVGRGPTDTGPQFDQQPIEVAAIADATHRAWLATDDPRWLDNFESCRSWFCGHNDVGVEMFDRASSGGYDGLTPTGPNLNQGAESTLAMLSTLQERMPT